MQPFSIQQPLCKLKKLSFLILDSSLRNHKKVIYQWIGVDISKSLSIPQKQKSVSVVFMRDVSWWSVLWLTISLVRLPTWSRYRKRKAKREICWICTCARSLWTCLCFYCCRYYFGCDPTCRSEACCSINIERVTQSWYHWSVVCCYSPLSSWAIRRVK